MSPEGRFEVRVSDKSETEYYTRVFTLIKSIRNIGATLVSAQTSLEITEEGTKAYGEQLRTARKSRGLNQKALSEMVGVSPSMISRYETGDTLPSRNNIIFLNNFIEDSKTED